MSQHRPRTAASELQGRLPASPDVYPQKLDLARQSALLIELDQAGYRSASFLDDRILAPATRGGWLPFDRLVEAAHRASSLRPLHFILHTGHVGSTLLSRLLEETGEVLSLREPLPLRTLADSHDAVQRPESLLAPARFGELLEAMLRLWSRGYPGTSCVVLKATSSAARLAPEILARRAGSRAVYLNLRARPALATLLAGSNSLVDLRGHGPGRMQRLSARLGRPLPPLHAMSTGELAAMSWLAESACRLDVLARFPGQVLALDFDTLLADVAGELERVLQHFGLVVPAQDLQRIASGPVLTRYSKAPEHNYGPEIRAQVLGEAQREHGAEIERGLRWLAEWARTDDSIAALVEGEPT